MHPTIIILIPIFSQMTVNLLQCAFIHLVHIFSDNPIIIESFKPLPSLIIKSPLLSADYIKIKQSLQLRRKNIIIKIITF